MAIPATAPPLRLLLLLEDDAATGSMDACVVGTAVAAPVCQLIVGLSLIVVGIEFHCVSVPVCTVSVGNDCAFVTVGCSTVFDSLLFIGPPTPLGCGSLETASFAMSGTAAFPPTGIGVVTAIMSIS
jgi:hypothetical protein